MSYAELFNNAAIIHINGNIVVPPSYDGEKNFIIPDEIVALCIEKYKLLSPGMRVLDPMCGIGTIPRVLNSLGGECIGIEIDENRYKIALELCNQNELSLGNCLDLPLAKAEFQCVFTSMPFSWFRNNQTIPANFALRFKYLLSAQGFVLLDSIPIANRAGEEWQVALRQCNYLEENGFKLVDMIRFKNTTSNIDENESVIMKFSIC